jgi:hypothetical protein
MNRKMPLQSLRLQCFGVILDYPLEAVAVPKGAWEEADRADRLPRLEGSS